MEDGNPIGRVPSAPDYSSHDGTETRFPAGRTVARKINLLTSFDRRELDQILRIYGRMVALGEWRDYAIDHLADRALFSIYRKASEVPLYQVIKEPRLHRRQGAFSVEAAGGYVLKRGRKLTDVLKVLEKKTLRLMESGR